MLTIIYFRYVKKITSFYFPILFAYDDNNNYITSRKVVGLNEYSNELDSL